MGLRVRKLATHMEEIHEEGNKAVGENRVIEAVMAVMKNPDANVPYVENLSPIIEECAPRFRAFLPQKEHWKAL